MKTTIIILFAIFMVSTASAEDEYWGNIEHGINSGKIQLQFLNFTHITLSGRGRYVTCPGNSPDPQVLNEIQSANFFDLSHGFPPALLLHVPSCAVFDGHITGFLQEDASGKKNPIFTEHPFRFIVKKCSIFFGIGVRSFPDLLFEVFRI